MKVIRNKNSKPRSEQLTEAMNKKLDAPNKKKEMIEALKETKGILKYAYTMVGITRPTHQRWLREDEEYAKECKIAEDETKDWVETKLLDKIREGDSTCLIFYAKTKMKDRGYVERQEITGANGLEIIIKEV
jgi:hypothetical protein